MGCSNSALTKRQPSTLSSSFTIVNPSSNSKDVGTIDITNCRYACPQRKDLAVCFVYFNIAHSKRILMNYLYTVNKLKVVNIPYFTLELVYDTPEISDAIRIQSSSAAFHKERLCSVLENHIPATYTKLLFLDADIVFAKGSLIKYCETNNIPHFKFQTFADVLTKVKTWPQEARRNITSLSA
jgi:hypothetical protein